MSVPPKKRNNVLAERREHLMTDAEDSASKFQSALFDAREVFAGLSTLENSLLGAADVCAETLRMGGKILICGNGGSAGDAQHLAGELIGRYKGDRPAWPAIALTADGAVLTCIANDYGFDAIFARQVTGLGRPGDVLIVFSTSGKSANVLLAMEAARSLQIKVIAFLGRDGGPAAALADLSLVVAHPQTARIQEGHQFLIHALMDAIEHRLGFAG
jgi:phosphoheptose isomerase